MYDKEKLAQISEGAEKWEETTLQKSQARFPEGESRFMTTSSESIRRLYTPLDVADLDYMDDLGMPGEYPFTRGVHASLYRGRVKSPSAALLFPGTPPGLRFRYRELHII